MATYSDIVQDSYLRPIPGASVYVFNRDGTDAAVSPNPVLTDTFGRFSFTAPDAVYNLEYRYGGVTVREDSVIVGDPVDYIGLTGPSNNTRASLSALKAAAITDKTSLYDGSLWTWSTSGAPYSADDVNTVKADSTPLSVGAWVRQDIGALTYQQAGGLRRRTDSKLGEAVSVADFGSIGDGTLHPLSERYATLTAAQVDYPHATALSNGIDWAAFQKAVNYCSGFTRWPELKIVGSLFLDRSVIINRTVDTTSDEFRISGGGKGATIAGSGSTIFFDSSLAAPGEVPVCEWVTFTDLRFESASYFDTTCVVSEKFLRVRALNCYFWLTRFYNSTNKYVQTLHFSHCNIRNWGGSFVAGKGLYDLKFTGCTVENGTNLIKCYNSSRGSNSVVIQGGVVEGLIGRTMDITGPNGVVLSGVYIENNATNDINTFAGTQSGSSILVEGCYIYNPNGPTIYSGTTDKAVSIGNVCYPSKLWSNANAINSATSMGDSAATLHDASYTGVVAGITCFGGVPVFSEVPAASAIRVFVATPGGALRTLAKASAIPSPSGGATIDTSARSAIDAIRLALINAGITL